jgi:hypothetical protein
LPVFVRGSASTNSNRRGYLYGAIVALVKSCNSLVFVSSPTTPARNTTYAVTTAVPRASSGAPTTPHSTTSGWRSNASSTSGPAML